MELIHAIGSNRQRWMLLGLIVIMAILVYLISRLVAVPGLLADDYLEYWAAGRLNLTGGNPYAADQLLALQRVEGRTAGAVMMWNPPWTLALTMPLSLLSFPLSRLLWLSLSIVMILISTNWTWTLFRETPGKQWIARTLAFTFFPTIFALGMGQIGPLLLLGVAGFLHFERKKRYWLAGAFVSLLAIKPHLLYLVFLAILFWSMGSRQRWDIIGGAAIIVLVETLAAMLFNPQVFNQYLILMESGSPFGWATPTLGCLLRLLFGSGETWLQFAPMAGGVVWFTFYGIKHRRTWLRADRISLMMLVSVVTAPFGWSFDQIVLIPVVLRVAGLMLDVHDAQTAWKVAIPYIIINIAAFALRYGNIYDYWLFWHAPALLVWYLSSLRLSNNTKKTVSPVSI